MGVKLQIPGFFACVIMAYVKQSPNWTWHHCIYTTSSSDLQLMKTSHQLKHTRYSIGTVYTLYDVISRFLEIPWQHVKSGLIGGNNWAKKPGNNALQAPCGITPTAQPSQGLWGLSPRIQSSDTRQLTENCHFSRAHKRWKLMKRPSTCQSAKEALNKADATYDEHESDNLYTKKGL